MSPREKASELFSAYRFVLSVPGAPLGEQKDSIAKQCALVCAEEMIIELKKTFDHEEDGPEHPYWKEVKQEINKL